jgi:hypothetical protein
MKYQRPAPLTKAEAEIVLASGDTHAMCEALVALALYEPDCGWTHERCIELARHSEWTLRAIAATCLGHLARIHGTLDLERVSPLLVELTRDPRTRGYAQDAVGDIKMFMGRDVELPE